VIALERRRFRVREISAEVDVLGRHDSAGAQRPAEDTQDVGRLLEMGKQEPRINHVHLRNLEGLPDIDDAKLDVADTELSRFRSCQIQLRLVDVECGHLARWRDASSQFQ